MLDSVHIIFEIAIWFFLLYTFAVFAIYLWIGVYAYGALEEYKNKNLLTDYSLIAKDPNAPPFSIIAPAYNEGMTIVENVRSLLSVYYNNLEIIIVNDGSKDDSVEKLIAAYELEAISFFVQGNLETKPIKNIYRSKNPAYKKLLVVDKHNGGKADALNVGVNVSSGDYIVCIDVDCILEQDALLKMAKPFYDQTDKPVIACGGSIRLANNCKIVNGKVVEVNLPTTLLGRMQALEYIRAFVLGRMAWSRASGLILISGAFGTFDKNIVLACGGYDPNTVGEDMELVVRMRRYMEEQKRPYQVLNIPDPLCWTEVPETKEILKRQRNRWMRGTMETLWKHRKLFFNPKYGKLGMISYPYWLFFEFLGPVVEFVGYLVFLVFYLVGILNWSFFFALTCLVLFIGVLYSIYAILVDLLSYQVYTKGKHLRKLIFTAMLEPFYFHPTVVWAGVLGVRDYFKKSHNWGDMQRQGFNPGQQNQSFWSYLKESSRWHLQHIGPLLSLFVVFMFIGVGFESFWYAHKFANLQLGDIFTSLFGNNVDFIFQATLIGSLIYYALSFLNIGFARNVLSFLCAGTVLAQLMLTFYFSESLNLLGADILYYNFTEAKHTLESAGVLTITNVLLLIFGVSILIFPFFKVRHRAFKSFVPASVFLLLGVVAACINPQDLGLKPDASDEFVSNAALSKPQYFTESILADYISNSELLSMLNSSDVEGDEVLISAEYPFLRLDSEEDPLRPLLHKAAVTPNVVLIIVEGLGHAYADPEGYIGNFTPFLDSLKQGSLYWDRAVSTSGRTFSVLPSLLGSLPFGGHGFLDIQPSPKNFNLINILKKHDFKTGFFYGGDAEFDNMAPFLRASGIDRLVQEADYDGSYKKLPQKGGESWGYDDQAVFNNYLKVVPDSETPYINVLLTLSTHSPFLINNSSKYEALYEKHMSTLKLKKDAEEFARSHKKQLVTVLNVDDALRNFFSQYKQRADFANTIFIITGDHSMPEIPLMSKIDRYHVPLIIYSPLVKQRKTFHSVVSHLDIAPTLVSYYRQNYGLKPPGQITWVGDRLSTRDQPNKKGYPMMQSKNLLVDYLNSPYHLVDKDLFKLADRMQEDKLEDKEAYNKMNKQFERYKAKNAVFKKSYQLVPDSLFNAYFEE